VFRLFWVAFWLGLLLHANSANAAEICPEIHYECLGADRGECLDPWALLAQGGALPYEISSLKAISRMTRAKGPFDVVATDCGSYGMLHSRPRAGRPIFGFIEVPEGCPFLDTSWRDRVQAALYWDVAENDFGFLLREFRHKTDSVLAEAWGATGSERVLVVTASINRPGLSRELGRRHRWRTRGMLEGYFDSRPTPHRQRRVRDIEAVLN